jgi:hypothetical protein
MKITNRHGASDINIAYIGGGSRSWTIQRIYELNIGFKKKGYI